MQIPDPHYMELADWANGTVYALGEYTSIAEFFPDTDWQRWGMQFFNNPSLGQLGPPNPYDFKDWKPWAERLQDALLSASGVDGTTSGGGPGPSFNSALLITQDNRFIITQSGNFIITQAPGTLAFPPLALANDANTIVLTDDSGANILTSQ